MTFLVGNIPDIEKFLTTISEQYPYNDTFTCEESLFIPTHTHQDDEVRLFLEGHATFIIDDVLVNCYPGKYLKIGAHCPHSFKYDGGKPLKVLRFFKNEKMWQANYIKKE
jgi:cupin superfamily acireductone dioxygenase involved in methionine salvage